jgi:hypothetical protein
MNIQTHSAPAPAGALPKIKSPAAIFALPPLPYADDALEPSSLRGRFGSTTVSTTRDMSTP